MEGRVLRIPGLLRGQRLSLGCEDQVQAQSSEQERQRDARVCEDVYPIKTDINGVEVVLVLMGENETERRYRIPNQTKETKNKKKTKDVEPTSDATDRP